MRPSFPFLLLPGLGGCADKAGPGPADPADTADTAAPLAPCGDGSWGWILDPAGSLHVRADGDDSGDGSASAPLATLDAALDLARETGQPIAVGPGEYETSLSLQRDLGDGRSDDGRKILGCGPGEVTLAAASSDGPILKVSAAQGVELAGFTLEGGQRALWIWQGATVAASAVHVLGSARVGIVINGSESLAALSDVEIRDPLAQEISGIEAGYGVSVQGGTLRMTGGGVWGASVAGVLVDSIDGRAELSGATIAGTLPDSGGRLGRGLQVQDLAQAALVDVALTDNHDAGLFALRSLSIETSGLEVAGTAAAALPSGEGTSGDGIVLTQGEAGYDASYFVATLEGSLVTGSARAGVLADGVSVALSGNTLAGNGYDPGGGAALEQGGALVTGDDPTFDLSESLELRLDPLQLDDLAE